MQRLLPLSASHRGRLGIDIAFVDGHEIGDFNDAFLDGLQVVAGVRQLDQGKNVNHAGDGRFALTDTDGFDNDYIVAGRFAGQHGFPGFFRDTAQRTRRGAWPNKGLHTLAQGLHARLVAED